MPSSKQKTMSENKIRTILKYRIKGYSLKTVGDILHLTKEGVRQIIEKNKNEPKLKKLYEEVEKTNKFLNRNIE